MRKFFDSNYTPIGRKYIYKFGAKYKICITYHGGRRCSLVLSRETMILPAALPLQTAIHMRAHATDCDRAHRAIRHDDLARYFVRHSRAPRNFDSAGLTTRHARLILASYYEWKSSRSSRATSRPWKIRGVSGKMADARDTPGVLIEQRERLHFSRVRLSVEIRQRRDARRANERSSRHRIILFQFNIFI